MRRFIQRRRARAALDRRQRLLRKRLEEWAPNDDHSLRLTRLLARLREETSGPEPIDPGSRRLVQTARSFLDFAEEIRGESRAVLPLWAGALAFVQQVGSRLRSRAQEVAGEGLGGPVAAATTALTALTIAGVLIVQSVVGGTPSAAASEASPAHSAASALRVFRANPSAHRAVAAGAIAPAKRILAARVDLGVGGVEGSTGIAEGDERVDVVAGVSAWLGPAEPFVEVPVWITCDPDSVPKSTICAVVKGLPSPPEDS
ncbi:MAG TPA: hypothetical protein VGB83_12500 [Actinomycetota bacterium]